MKLNLIMLVLLSALSFATTKTYAQDETLIVDNSSQTLTADNISQMSLIHQFGEHTRGVAFNPDGTLLAIASQVSDNDYHIEIVDVQSGELLGHIGGRMDFIRDIIWSPDSLRIATISGRRTGGGTRPGARGDRRRGGARADRGRARGADDARDRARTRARGRLAARVVARDGHRPGHRRREPQGERRRSGGARPGGRADARRARCCARAGRAYRRCRVGGAHGRAYGRADRGASCGAPG